MKKDRFAHPLCLGLACIAMNTGWRPARAQTGEFITPALRGGPGTLFAYWDRFTAQVAGKNFLINNAPAAEGGADLEGNPTNFGIGPTAGRLQFVQDGATDAFLTSSGAIYSFSAATAFTVGFQSGDGEGDVGNVIFQIQTGGVRLDIGSIRLHFQPAGGGAPVPVAPIYKALDDPRTGGFSERVISAYQWNLEGLGCRDFTIRIVSPDASMPVWQAQLDVVPGAAFTRELGYVLNEAHRPSLRFGRPGAILRNLPEGDEERFFTPGQVLNLSAEPLPGFVHVGWQRGQVVTEETSHTLAFGTADETIVAIFSPTGYAVWRDRFFEHANTLLGQSADNLNDAISGPEADPDRDGFNNAAEFAFGGDPYIPDAAAMTPVPGVVSIAGEAHATLTFRRWAAADELMEAPYVVEGSEGGRHWAPVQTVEMTSPLQSNGTRLVTVRSVNPLPPQAPLLLRASLQLP